MKVIAVASSVSPETADHQYLISYIINDTVAIDAGSLGFYSSPFEQAKIRHVFISHTHADHVASLPIFIENAYELKPECPTIHGSDIVLDSIQRDLFNNRIWPDFIALSKNNPFPFLHLSRFEAGQTIEVEGLKITAVGVNHLVPTVGYIIEQGNTCVVIPSDTGPTEEIWRLTREHPHLKAIFLEAAFPDSMARMADISKHLTPASFGAELAKLNRPDVAIYAIHIKPRFRHPIIQELNELGMPNLHIGQFNIPYEF